MRNLSSHLERFIDYIHHPNWTEFQSWYQQLEPSERQSILSIHRVFLFEKAILFANANIAKLICDENPSIIFNHIQTRDLFTFKYLFDIHHPELFTYLFEKAPLAIQNQVRTYFYHLGIGYIDFFQPYLLIRILHLSPRILNPILRFDDDLLIRKALSSYFPQIIDYLVQYPPDDFLAIIENGSVF